MKRSPTAPLRPDARRPARALAGWGAPANRRAWLAGAIGALAAGSLGACGLAPRAGPVPRPTAAGLASYDHVLLGEVHDNARHHAARARLLDALLADGRPTVVLLEMMGRRHDAELARAVDEARRAGLPGGPEGLAALADRMADAGGLDRRGWGWPLHRPLVEAALRGGARLRGANLEAAEARSAVREGAQALPPDVRDALARDTAWNEARQGEMLRLIDEGHCGLLPQRLHAPMVLAQRARDAAMALAMVRAFDETPAGLATSRPRTVLLAGNGHVRRDLGVPRVLEALGVPGDRIVAVGYLEPGVPAIGFDRVDEAPAPPGRPDPCEGLRRRT